jgi:hypothetical protein
MKKIPFLVLSLLTIPSYAQSLLGILNQHQNSLKKPEPVTSSQASGTSSTVIASSQAVNESVSSTPSNKIECESDDQTSLPLAYITSLIQEKGGQLDISHDQRTGKLTISSADMIGNCSSMIQWRINEPVINGKKAYALEAVIRKGENCTPEQGCSYKLAKVEKGEFKNFEPNFFKPTLVGFEECLKKSGVVKDGKLDPGAIYNNPINESFDNASESRRLFLVSNGAASKNIKSKYGENGKFDYIHGCAHYESAHPKIKALLTYEDAEKERLDAEAAKLRDCKADEYGKLAEFIEKYEGYQSELGDVRDKLILEAAKNAAINFDAGKFNEEDLKVLGDFDRYVVQPKIDRARALYEELLDLEGDGRKVKQEELVKLLADISALGKKPYFTSEHTKKLLQSGKFDEAEKLNTMKLVIENHQRLGAKENNVVISTGVASQRIAASKAAFATTLEQERERYEYRTGQASGKAQHNGNLAQRMRNNINLRTQNFNAEIQLEYERMQPNGYCYKYWRNTPKCIQDSMERIQELQAMLQHYNNVDQERVNEYEAKAKEYGELEAQGRRYLAAQNGEEIPAETSTTPTPVPQDTTVPTPRPLEQPQGQNGVYSFQYPGNQNQQPPQQFYQQQAQLMPQQYQNPMVPNQNNNMFMQPQNPFYYNLQQPSFMGQQAYGYQPDPYGYGRQEAYSFNWGGGTNLQPYQQPQMPFYNQSIGAYGQFNYYGR